MKSFVRPVGHENALERARLSLEGLSVGDAFGQCFFDPAWTDRADEAVTPDGPWPYTDDTEMSLSVLQVLADFGGIDQDVLAQSIARRYSYDRAYGPSMHRVLERIRAGEHWREVTAGTFGGQGSYGNGAAMRAAPVGAYFHGAGRQCVATEAMRCAEVTHAHPEGIAGAVAVALAAARACDLRDRGMSISPPEFLQDVIDAMPDSEVRSGLRRAQEIRGVKSRAHAAAVLGNGTAMAAQDTVPYALWCAAVMIEDYENALWLALSAGGDRDTLCAITGGVVACRVGHAGIPLTWREAREPLPDWIASPAAR